jgi:hypothetical protein
MMEAKAAVDEKAYELRWKAVAAVDRGIGEADRFWQKVMDPAHAGVATDEQLEVVEKALELALGGITQLRRELGRP